MNKPKDLKGRTFSRLTVLKFAGKINDFPTWLCECICGKLVKINSYKLLNGHTKSCGCLQKESRMKSPGEAGLNAVIRGYKKNAENRSLAWELSNDEVKTITSKNCFYCEKEPTNELKSHIGNNGRYLYNGIDRLDNYKGYTADNVVPCCYKCNVTKKDFSIESMVKILTQLGYKVEK